MRFFTFKVKNWQLFVLLVFFVNGKTWAQTDFKIGINQGNKNASAVLELESTTKGFLMPRMSPAQMAAISNPAVGLQIYNTTDSCIYVYRGVTGWYATCGAFNAWTLFGNTGINPATTFLGTTDAQPVVLKTNGIERIRFDATGAITQSGTGVVTFTGNTKATNGLDVTTAALTANAGATITGPAGGGGTVNINTVGANTTNIGTAVSTTNINGANLFVTALPAGSTTTDALVAVNRTTGKADTLNIANLVSTGITANNGLTKTGSNIALGGTLVANTTIDQSTFSLGINNGTGTGATNIGNSASTTTILGATNVNTGTSATATNIGNALSTTTVLGATNVNTTGAATTSIGNSGSTVTIAGTTGITGTTTINTTGTSNTSIGNATGTNTVLGTTNINTTGTANTSIGNATGTNTVTGNNLIVSNLPSGATTDSLVSVNNATGAVRKLKIADVVGGAITADNGLNKSTANNVQLGGTLLKNTSVDQGTFTLTFNGTGTGATNIGNSASSVAIAGTTSVTGATTINTIGTNNTSIGNATGTITTLGATNVNTTGSAATTIGNATSTTNINGTSLNVTSLASGALTDSLVSVNPATGKINRLSVANVVANSFTANNGLTKTGSNVALGGTLNANTTIDQSTFSLGINNGTGTGATNIGNAASTTNINGTSLNVTSLASGALTDSLVSVNPATGKVNRLSIANVVANSFTANNGLTKTGSNVQLGGTLVQATAITQAGFDVNYSGGNLAIGQTTSPNSTFQVTGSHGVSYKKVTSAASPYTITSSDFIVLANATSGAVTLNLPTASATLTGRIYTVGKSDEGTNTVTFSPPLRLTEATTVSSVNFAIKYRIVCDGTDWWIYNE